MPQMGADRQPISHALIFHKHIVRMTQEEKLKLNTAHTFYEN